MHIIAFTKCQSEREARQDHLLLYLCYTDAIQKERSPEIAKRAYDEALSLCGVPKYMDQADLERVVEKVAIE